jgi:hypothetical protein
MKHLPFALTLSAAAALTAIILLAAPAHSADAATCDGGPYDSDALTCSASFAVDACAATSDVARCVNSATAAALGVYRKADRAGFTCSTDAECNAVNIRARRAAWHLASAYTEKPTQLTGRTPEGR